MCSEKALPLLGIVVLLFCVSTVSGVVLDCETVTSYFSACSTFITYGTPDPFPGSPCCLSVSSMNNTLSTTEDRRQACRCIMGLIATYSSHAIAIATLPGFCGISFGFTIHPNTECDYIPRGRKCNGGHEVWHWLQPRRKKATFRN